MIRDPRRFDHAMNFVEKSVELRALKVQAGLEFPVVHVNGVADVVQGAV